MRVNVSLVPNSSNVNAPVLVVAVSSPAAVPVVGECMVAGVPGANGPVSMRVSPVVVVRRVPVLLICSLYTKR